MPKIFSIFTIVYVLFIGVLSGCGANDSQSASSKEDSDKQSSSSSESNSTESSEQEVVTIKVGHVGAPVSPQQGAAEIFVDLVEEKTSGSVKIKLYPSSQLGDERELVEGIQMGTIDGGIISSGLFSSTYEVMGAFEVPFLFKNREHALKVNNGEIGQELLANLESKSNLKALSIWDHGFRQLTNDVRPIKKPSDLKGLKIRSPQVPSYSVALEVLGATPVPMAFSELYVALDRGVVDGQHNPLMHVQGQRFYEVQKHMTVMDFAYTPNILTFSNKVWDKLSEEQRKQVQEASLETAKQWSEAAAKENKKLLKELKGKMNVLTSDDVNRQAFVDIVVEKGYPKYREEFSDEFVDFLEKVQEATPQ